LLARRQHYLFDICQFLYIQSWNPDDGQKNRPKQVELFQNRIILRHWCIWLVLLLKYIKMHSPMNVKRNINSVEVFYKTCSARWMCEILRCTGFILWVNRYVRADIWVNCMKSVVIYKKGNYWLEIMLFQATRSNVARCISI